MYKKPFKVFSKKRYEVIIFRQLCRIFQTIKTEKKKKRNKNTRSYKIKINLLMKLKKSIVAISDLLKVLKL